MPCYLLLGKHAQNQAVLSQLFCNYKVKLSEYLILNEILECRSKYLHYEAKNGQWGCSFKPRTKVCRRIRKTNKLFFKKKNRGAENKTAAMKRGRGRGSSDQRKTNLVYSNITQGSTQTKISTIEMYSLSMQETKAISLGYWLCYRCWVWLEETHGRFLRNVQKWIMVVMVIEPTILAPCTDL